MHTLLTIGYSNNDWPCFQGPNDQRRGTDHTFVLDGLDGQNGGIDHSLEAHSVHITNVFDTWDSEVDCLADTSL